MTPQDICVVLEVASEETMNLGESVARSRYALLGVGKCSILYFLPY